MLLILLSLVLFFASLLSFLKFILDSNKLQVKGPFPIPFLGNGHLFFGDTQKFMKTLGQLAEKYNNAARVYLLGSRYIVFSAPQYMEAVFSSTELITKGESYYYLHPWLGQGLLTSTGNKWRTHRKMITPAFHFNIMKTFLPIILKNQKVLIKKLNELADGRYFDLFPIIALAALDNVSECAMGVPIHAQEDSESEYVRAIAEISELTMMKMFNPLMRSDFLFNLSPYKTVYDRSLNILHSYTEKVIKERHQQIQSSNSTLEMYTSEFGTKKKVAFLDLLLLSEVNGERLDFISIREEVDTFMFEGHDTTTSGICFILHCISKNKGIDDKILAELNEILGDNYDSEPSYSDLQQMKYLEMVIKESLRLYPSVPIFARQTTKATEIAGLLIPKDTTISLDIFHMHRDPKFFEDPLEFRPERFDINNPADKERNVYSWVAFSAGSRNCIGQKFAMMELKVAISSIVRNFKIIPSGEELKLASDLILRSENGVKVKLIPRNKLDNNI